MCIVSHRRWQRRDTHPESWWWETEAGRCWLIRLVVATLYTFGLTRGVGAETISEFFGRLRLETHVGCSPSALRGVMHALEQAILETATAWEHEGVAAGEVRPIIGAVDETFLERMMLVFMDLVSGYLLFEEVAEDRTYTTWYALVEARLEALGVGVWYLVSDRAKALIKLAEQGLECVSIPDVFHLIHDLVQELFAGHVQSSAASAAGLTPGAGVPANVPGAPSKQCRSPASASRGGGV